MAVPLSALALVMIPLTGTAMNEAAAPILFFILGIFSLGRWLRLRVGVPCSCVTCSQWCSCIDFGFDPGTQDWTDVVFVLSLAVPPYVFGRIVRRSTSRAACWSPSRK